MARKRFTPAEKALISADTRVEWQNVSQWHPATLTTGEIITEDGWQHVVAVNEQATTTVGKGQVIHVSPGHIRAPHGVTATPEQAPSVIMDTDADPITLVAEASANASEQAKDGHSGYGKRKYDQGYQAGIKDTVAKLSAYLADPALFTATTSGEEFAASLAETFGAGQAA